LWRGKKGGKRGERGKKKVKVERNGKEKEGGARCPVGCPW